MLRLSVSDALTVGLNILCGGFRR